jgi:hypothetical protein
MEAPQVADADDGGSYDVHSPDDTEGRLLRIVRVDRSIWGMSLSRHTGWMVAAALFAALLLPVVVYYTGTATLGPYSRGGLMQFLGQFWADVLRLRPHAWLLLLGPVVLVTAWRVVVTYAWSRSGR